jgi:hypothetical protein
MYITKQHMWNKKIWHALIIKWLLLHLLGPKAIGTQEKITLFLHTIFITLKQNVW